MSNRRTHDEPPDWQVVCMGCMRVKRNGKWTLERVSTVVGVSTGYCNECFERERRKPLDTGR